MADWRTGSIESWRNLSPTLATFQLSPQPATRFPAYLPGQHIALRREHCRLTRRTVDSAGQVRYVPDVDEAGRPMFGPVSHSYSISSAPYETQQTGRLEFYVVLDTDRDGMPGRMSGSLFDLTSDSHLDYVDRITGTFTLPERAASFRSVLLVGTGTGLAPFVAMLKQLDHDVRQNGSAPDVRYTLLHVNRTREELAYHDELTQIEAEARFDFLYIPSVSRPGERDAPAVEDARLGRGRANNLLRYIFELPMKEEEALQAAQTTGGEARARAQSALDIATVPRLPGHLTRAELKPRFQSAETVVLTCGNPSSMADIQHVAEARHLPFVKEEW